MPFGPYTDFDECVAKNSDKSSPQGYCAWLHHKITGAWPGQMQSLFPEPFWKSYDEAMAEGKSEKDAFQIATEAAKTSGWNESRFGWLRQLQAPEMKAISGVRIFGEGTWTDSAGYKKTWAHEDLQSMIDAFEAGVPAIVPLKCGHTSDEFNEKIAETLGVPQEVITGENGQGQISLGKATALQLKGSWIIASFDKVPEPIANLIEGGQYSTVSVEIEDKVGDYGPVITGVALLGAEEPAVAGATLERALVFGGSRKGARVYSFQVGDDIPVSELRAEYEDIRAKLSEIVKGKRGAPLFRALFGNLSDIFDRITNGRHSAPEGESDMSYEPDPEALLQKGRPPKAWWDRCEAKVSTWPGVNDVAAFCGSVWYHDDPIPSGSFASDEAADKAEIEFQKRSDRAMEIKKAFGDMKAEDIKNLSLKDLAAKLQDAEGEVTVAEIVDALPAEPAKGIKDIAAALGLGEEATVEEILAAIAKLTEGAPAVPAEGEMVKELRKANDRIAALEAEKVQRDSMSAWEEKTAKLKSIPGTPREYAISLAEIEGKAGKEAAETQYKALEKANELAENATKIVGTSRTSGPSDFDNEVTKYMKEHTDASKAQAIEAVMKEHPELFFARRDDWNQ